MRFSNPKNLDDILKHENRHSMKLIMEFIALWNEIHSLATLNKKRNLSSQELLIKRLRSKVSHLNLFVLRRMELKNPDDDNIKPKLATICGRGSRVN